MRTWFPVLLAVTLTVTSAWAQDATGEWLVEDGNAHIRIVDCDGTLWGVVAWEKTPGYDGHNPDRAKRDAPTLGMPVLRNMKPTEPGHWEGEVYNARNGRSYDASMELRNTNTLRVEGCALGILCGSEDWTRVAQTGTNGLNTPGAPASAPAADFCAGIARRAH